MMVIPRSAPDGWSSLLCLQPLLILLSTWKKIQLTSWRAHLDHVSPDFWVWLVLRVCEISTGQEIQPGEEAAIAFLCRNFSIKPLAPQKQHGE